MKHKKKNTTAALVLVTEEAMIGTLNRYCTVSLELARRTAALEQAVAKLKAAHDEDPQVIQLRGELAVLESSVALYAQNNRDTLFAEKKSRDYQNAVIGFRTNPPSVGKRVPKDTFEAICLRLAELDWGQQYVDWEPKLQKDALLRDRAELKESQLKEAGLIFQQDEHFFIEPKSELVERSAKPVQEVAA